MKKIWIPVDGGSQEIESVQNFVIVGANGSGKSQLGAWIERNPNDRTVLRISAQRALNIPDTIHLMDEEADMNFILYGNDKNKDKGYKWGWYKGSKIIDDYERTLSAVIGRKNKENNDYMQECKRREKEGLEKEHTPETIDEKIIKIWDSVFPYRKIEIVDGKIKAKVNAGQEYPAKMMSDGERVAIYLISQCLIAPEGSLIIIDEPELHLHKSIMHLLWDNIERCCTDKTLIYITHDLDFASSRKESTKIWVKSFDGNAKWDWEVLPAFEEIPDSLMMEVLGNRKPILFVEGIRGSYDAQIYPYAYENYNVIPVKDCHHVIELTKAFNRDEILKLHHLDIKGLIDRDYMPENDIQGYKDDKIYTLDVAEVENLYIVEDVVKIVAENQGLDPEEKFEEVKEFVFEEFNKEYYFQLTSMCTREIRSLMGAYTKPKENTKEALENRCQEIVNSININEIYSRNKNKLDNLINLKDYNGLLMVYNRKSLGNRISPILGLKIGEYPNLVLRLLKSEKGPDIISAIKPFVPDIEG